MAAHAPGLMQRLVETLGSLVSPLTRRDRLLLPGAKGFFGPRDRMLVPVYRSQELTATAGAWLGRLPLRPGASHLHGHAPTTVTLMVESPANSRRRYHEQLRIVNARYFETVPNGVDSVYLDLHRVMRDDQLYSIATIYGLPGRTTPGDPVRPERVTATAMARLVEFVRAAGVDAVVVGSPTQEIFQVTDRVGFPNIHFGMMPLLLEKFSAAGCSVGWLDHLDYRQTFGALVGDVLASETLAPTSRQELEGLRSRFRDNNTKLPSPRELMTLAPPYGAALVNSAPVAVVKPGWLESIGIRPARGVIASRRD